MIFKARKTTAKRKAGDDAEYAALLHLEKNGLRLLHRNYQCKYGEIDLIMKTANTLVFVEVRLRKSSQFGSAAETVTAQKQQKVILSSQHYLLEKKLPENTAMRFDVVASDGHNLDWIPAAF
ncbi:putative endonuclease [Alteromonadaceae bacterium Bs31]|nr:putative endonuclease [Alteromonadaceae bacterium Bs31]